MHPIEEVASINQNRPLLRAGGRDWIRISKGLQEVSSTQSEEHPLILLRLQRISGPGCQRIFAPEGHSSSFHEDLYTQKAVFACRVRILNASLRNIDFY